MRFLLAVVTAVHAVCHLVRFAGAWRLLVTPGTQLHDIVFQGRIDLGELASSVWGLGWIGLAVCFGAVSVGVSRRSSWWLAALEVLVVGSLIFCALGWPETRLGVPANLLVLVIAFATIQFGNERLAIKNDKLEAIWSAIEPGTASFDPGHLNRLPPLVQRHLRRAIGTRTAQATAVRIQMHGEIRLKSWRPFRAEQVITPSSLVWAASLGMNGLPVVGSDQVLDGACSMQWRLFDFIPVMTAAGPDVTRSGIGRLQVELAVWNPSFLAQRGIRWSNSDLSRPLARFDLLGEPARIELEIDELGRLRSVKMQRWGDPDGGSYGYKSFGAFIDEERTFEGYTVPSRMRAGWFFEDERFESSGEFFRATVDAITFK